MAETEETPEAITEELKEILDIKQIVEELKNRTEAQIG